MFNINRIEFDQAIQKLEKTGHRVETIKLQIEPNGEKSDNHFPSFSFHCTRCEGEYAGTFNGANFSLEESANCDYILNSKLEELKNKLEIIELGRNKILTEMEDIKNKFNNR